MRTKHIAVLSALLLANVAGGMAFAESGQQGGPHALPRQAASQMSRTGEEEEGEEGFFSALFGRFTHHGKSHGFHHDDDDDDEGGHGLTRNGPANPDAPVPDSGVFNGHARPTVQVH